MNALISLVPLIMSGADEVPVADDVKAGWTALVVFVALAVALGLLGWSLVRHLGKARTNADGGSFDPSDPPRQRH